MFCSVYKYSVVYLDDLATNNSKHSVCPVPTDWTLCRYRGQLVEEVEVIPISATVLATVFAMSHVNASNVVG